MNYEDVKAKLLWNWTHDEPVASEVYTDDALLEFPQSGEKFRGDLVDRETIYQAIPSRRPRHERRTPSALNSMQRRGCLCESRRQAASDQLGQRQAHAAKRSSAQTITASSIASTAGTRNHSATAATPTPAARASMTNC